MVMPTNVKRPSPITLPEESCSLETARLTAPGAIVENPSDIKNQKRTERIRWAINAREYDGANSSDGFWAKLLSSSS